MAPPAPKPNAAGTQYHASTPNTWRWAASTEYSITWRTISLRGSSLASTCCHSASNWRARSSSPASSASRISVKWKLNCRKPSVTYSTAMLRTREHGQRPRHPAMLRLARVEVRAGPARPRTQHRVDRGVARQRPHLLDQEREQDGEKAHPGMINVSRRGSG